MLCRFDQRCYRDRHFCSLLVPLRANAASHILCDMNEIFSIWLNFKLFVAGVIIIIIIRVQCSAQSVVLFALHRLYDGHLRTSLVS